MAAETTKVQPAGLIDSYGRRITYLRISVTDRCDFRCVYCMDPNQRFAPRDLLLSLEEISQVARTFVKLGVRKIRLTGGEPLTRKNILWLMREVAALPELDELVITTNGSQLAAQAKEIRAAGVKRINISLDSLHPQRFRNITRKGDLNRVLRGIDAALAAGFERIKLNTVILKHRNHDEVIDLVLMAVDKGINISFIEEMPVGQVGEHNRAEVFYSSDSIRSDLQSRFQLVPTTETTGGPARYYRIPGTETRVGFISPHSHNFCSDCNRVRVTAEGRLLLCLGQEHSLDLRRILREYPGDEAQLIRAVRDAMQIKPEGHEFSIRVSSILTRHMNVTGG